MKESKIAPQKGFSFWKILVIGVVIRLVLMPITLHSDVWAILFSEYFFAFKGVANIYEYLSSLPADSPINLNYGPNFFTYPPLAYYTLGIFGFILKPLYDSNFLENLAENLPKIVDNAKLFSQLFLVKLPYLFFDLGILALLLKYFQNSKQKALIAGLWLFNPLSLYTSYMIGQFDVIPVFFVLLSLFLVKQKRFSWAAFSLGVGGAYKMFPLFFLPFLAVSGGKDFKEKVKLFFIGIIPYLVSIFPFLGSSVFRQTVLFSNQSQKMLFAKINVSGAEYLSVFVVLYVFLFFSSCFKKAELWKWYLSVLLIFFSLTHFHPQWFLWISPLLVIFWTEYPKLGGLVFLLYFCWLGITLFFEPSLSLSLLAPILPSLLSVKPLSDTAGRFYDVFQLKSLLRSLFAGTALYVSVLCFSKTASEEK